jgi:glycogenin glucosyltransferase
MLCGGDEYVPGAEVLGRSLINTDTDVPRLVLTTSDVSEGARRRLTRQGWEIRDVERIPSPDGQARMFSRFAHTFTKLRAWELSDYDRVVILDSDTAVVRNVDELFARPSFAAAPDFFLPDRFNSGVMVIQPSRKTFGRMMQALANSGTYDGGDQGFLNSFYPDWYAMPVANRLPAGFNQPQFLYQFAKGRPAIRDVLDRETRVIHYMLQKPWQAATFTGGAELWWKLWFEIHPEGEAPWSTYVHTFEDRTFNYLSTLLLGQ